MAPRNYSMVDLKNIYIYEVKREIDRMKKNNISHVIYTSVI